jgi:MFS family permease
VVPIDEIEWSQSQEIVHILFSQVALGASFIALGLLTRTLTEFYLLYATLALATGTLPITFSKLVTERFVAHRGLALGILQAGSGICAVFAPAYITWFMERGGWRIGYVAVGLLPLLVALPLCIWLLPTGDRVPPIAVPVVTSAPDLKTGSGIFRLFKNYRFWTMGVAFFLLGSAVSGILSNLAPLLAARHFPRDAAVVLQGAFGGVIILGRIVVGMLFDRVWAPLVGACFLLPAGLSAWVLHSTLPDSGDAIPIVLIGLATGAEVDLCAYLTSRYFPFRDYGKLYGAQYLFLVSGSGLSAPFYGHLYDRCGNYGLTLALVATGFIASALLLLSLGPYPQPARDPHYD